MRKSIEATKMPYFDQIAVVHLRADVQVAEMDKLRPFELRRQIRHRQRSLDELHPVRLPPPGVEPNAGANPNNTR
jgi:hypothetical protein